MDTKLKGLRKIAYFHEFKVNSLCVCINVAFLKMISSVIHFDNVTIDS